MIQVFIGKNKTSLELKEYHKFDWLNEVEVFSIFNQQDSGNISFGIQENNERYFVKYAGARNLEYTGEIQAAIQRLKEAEEVYRHIAHPHLTPFLTAFQTERGYGLKFKWVDGECMHNHWDFTPFEKYNSPDSPFVKLRNLPLQERISLLTQIYEFATFVEAKGYVMVDFYDGSILYDFNNGELHICDIDFFRKGPLFNDIGEDFWGSSRYKAPEEYQLNAAITSATNVYTLAGLAFAFIGGRSDKSFEKWEASRILYNICIKALENNPSNRFNTISSFYHKWKESLSL
ncbi:serine/threonine protein kinase [Falsibacillus albus]|uniref:Serine/threonine protein kinase n=1 Tax=Falsibacillus albus TaxID=2478915 RepID=A0A3L7JTH9_9BACI|nr:serine/threonine protein kinase [Falsibacillus albus]RLQ93585.1 serine/threonine protein kinase [Falsibacillus albus]